MSEFRDFFGPTTGNETSSTLPEVLKDTGGYYTISINKVFHNFFRPEFDNDFDVTTIDECMRELSWNNYIKVPDEQGVTITNDGLGSYGWGKVPRSGKMRQAIGISIWQCKTWYLPDSGITR